MSSKYFSDEKVNGGRQPELDLLKALCVVGMIFTHVLLDLSDDAMPKFIDEYGMEFFGAATFMICMGIGMGYMHNQSSKAYVARGFGLLTIGQFLNICRNAVPNLIAWWIKGEQFFIANALLVLQSDIMTFAGLAFLLMALLKKLKMSDLQILILSVVMSFLALLAWHYVPQPKNYLVMQLVGYFIISDAEAYFPLFCYFIFVAFGYFVGGYYPRIKDKDALANRVMLICFPIAAVYYTLRFTLPMSWLPEMGPDLQYNMKPTPDAIATCLFTLGFLALLYKLLRLWGKELPPVVLHFSKYINNYYCIHYMFVIPVQTILIATTGELMPGHILPLLYACFVTVACYFIIEMNERHWHIHFATLRGWKMIVFASAVWIATFAITAYCYPRIMSFPEVKFANVWNDYLLP